MDCEGCQTTLAPLLDIQLPVAFMGTDAGYTMRLCQQCMKKLLDLCLRGCESCGDLFASGSAYCYDCTKCRSCDAHGAVEWCDECHECDHEYCHEGCYECNDAHADCVGCGTCLDGGTSGAKCAACAAVVPTPESTAARSDDGAIEYDDGLTVVFRN